MAFGKAGHRGPPPTPRWQEEAKWHMLGPVASESVRSERRSVAVRVLLVVPFLAVLALSGWEGVQDRDSTGAHAGVVVVVALAVVATVVAAVVRHRAAPASPEAPADGTDRADGRGRAMVAGSVTWVVLFAAVVAWDAFSFSEQSPNTPTLSDLVGHITQWDAGRAALFALWIAAGWLIATAKPRR